MKFLKLFIFMNLGFLCACSAQIEVSCDVNQTNLDLEKVYKKDQDVRREMMKVLSEYQKTGEGALKLMQISMKQNKLDKNNQEYVTELLEKCGWSDDLSEDAHSTIFLVLQHSDKDMMEKYIGLLEEKVNKELLAKDDLGTMQDRLLMYQGKKQLYGTQTISEEDGKVNILWPVENPEQLAQRRKEMGMVSLEDYFKIAKDSFNVEMIWDKTLTLDKAIEMR